MKEIDDLVAQVAAQKSVVESAVTLINGIPALIAAAVANADQATKDAVAAVTAELKAQAQPLADAITQNTPITPMQAKQKK